MDRHPEHGGHPPSCPTSGDVGQRLIDDIRRLVADIQPVPDDDDAPLEMDSLAVVMLVEALEDRLGLHVSAREVVPENLGSIAAIAAYVAGKTEREAGDPV